VVAGFRKTRHNLGRLLGSYVVVAIVALAVLVVGFSLWYAIVPPSSVVGAFIIGEATLLLLLAMRFWQRATTVAFYVRELAEPMVEDVRTIPAFAAPAAP
jgi:hypothetical protein